MTVDKLQAATQGMRPSVSPSERLKVLDEMFQVREMEERYLDGEFGKEHARLATPLCMAHADCPGLAKMGTLLSTYLTST